MVLAPIRQRIILLYHTNSVNGSLLSVFPLLFIEVICSTSTSRLRLSVTSSGSLKLVFTTNVVIKDTISLNFIVRITILPDGSLALCDGGIGLAVDCCCFPLLSVIRHFSNVGLSTFVIVFWQRIYDRDSPEVNHCCLLPPPAVHCGDRSLLYSLSPYIPPLRSS